MDNVFSGRQLDLTVAVLLEQSDRTVELEKSTHGMMVDIWATDRDGGTLVVECKTFGKLVGEATARQFARTVEVLRREQSKLEAWLVTTSGFTPNAHAVLASSGIKGMTLDEVFAQFGKDEEELGIDDSIWTGGGTKSQSRDTRVFVIMPFNDHMLDVFMLAVRWVTEKLGMVAKRSDDIDHNGEIIQQIQAAIREYDIVVGDTSGSNPNVCYEIGFAHGLGKQCVLMCEKGNSLPFDLQGKNHLMYENILDLRVKLEKKLTEVRGSSS
ncbi:MAG: restriction endonuclease [Bryobacterales bacterium]|nr:restriction endonuclease [Bryobacterales bacterium]